MAKYGEVVRATLDDIEHGAVAELPVSRQGHTEGYLLDDPADTRYVEYPSGAPVCGAIESRCFDPAPAAVTVYRAVDRRDDCDVAPLV